MAANEIYHGTKAVQDALNDTAGVKASWADCVCTGPLHYTNGAPVGEIESYRELRDDTNRIELLADEVNGDDTYGVALRYYAENLNSQNLVSPTKITPAEFHILDIAPARQRSASAQQAEQPVRLLLACRERPLVTEIHLVWVSTRMLLL